MIRYEHTQRGTVLVISLLAAAALCLSFPAPPSAPRNLLLVVAGILALSAFLFSSLTIRVTDRELQWQFGPGLIHKQLPLSEIRGVAVVRTRLAWGWGIHFTPRGWLYNVSGFQAVSVTLKSGRNVLLGTDEPEQLETAIRLALS